MINNYDDRKQSLVRSRHGVFSQHSLQLVGRPHEKGGTLAITWPKTTTPDIESERPVMRTNEDETRMELLS